MATLPFCGVARLLEFLDCFIVEDGKDEEPSPRDSV